LIRHGASHGLAAFISMIAAGLLVYLLRAFIPDMLRWVEPISRYVAQIPAFEWVSEEALNTLVLAVILAFIWGMVFKWKHVK
jgi:hypothetical protein